ncbi:MAG: hypothetical protein ACLFM7_02850 [Bacteroidales bacterium]
MIFQFIITIVLLIGTTVVSRQMNFINNKDPGINNDQIMPLIPFVWQSMKRLPASPTWRNL